MMAFSRKMTPRQGRAAHILNRGGQSRRGDSLGSSSCLVSDLLRCLMRSASLSLVRGKHRRTASENAPAAPQELAHETRVSRCRARRFLVSTWWEPLDCDWSTSPPRWTAERLRVRGYTSENMNGPVCTDTDKTAHRAFFFSLLKEGERKESFGRAGEREEGSRSLQQLDPYEIHRAARLDLR